MTKDKSSKKHSSVFCPHLCLDVLERRRADEGEADEENVGLGVRERAKTIIVLLSGGIPESEVDGLSVNHHIGGVVVEADKREK